ncbi:hypothetical protein HG619_00730 [Pseudomonas syringae]|nr:hypothetical protein [Pseudomonas syringae]
MITITARESFAGFTLSNPLAIQEGVTVITGKNGCGKTRLLEIIASHSDILSESGERFFAKNLIIQALPLTLVGVTTPLHI